MSMLILIFYVSFCFRVRSPYGTGGVADGETNRHRQTDGQTDGQDA